MKRIIYFKDIKCSWNHEFGVWGKRRKKESRLREIYSKACFQSTIQGLKLYLFVLLVYWAKIWDWWFLLFFILCLRTDRNYNLFWVSKVSNFALRLSSFLISQDVLIWLSYTITIPLCLILQCHVNYKNWGL